MEGDHHGGSSNTPRDIPETTDSTHRGNTTSGLVNAPAGTFFPSEASTCGGNIQAPPNSPNVLTHQMHPRLNAGGSLLPADTIMECRQESRVEKERDFHSLSFQPLIQSPQPVAPHVSPEGSQIIQSADVTVGLEGAHSAPAYTMSPFAYSAGNAQMFFVQAAVASYQQPITQFPPGMHGITMVPTQTQVLEAPVGYMEHFPQHQPQVFLPGGALHAVAAPIPHGSGQPHLVQPDTGFNVAVGGQGTNFPATRPGPPGGGCFQVPTSPMVDSRTGSYAATLAALPNLALQYSMSGAPQAQSGAQYSGNENPQPPFENTLHGPGLLLLQRQLALTALQTQYENQGTLVNHSLPRSHTEWQSPSQRAYVSTMPYYERQRIISHDRNAAVLAWLDDCERWKVSGNAKPPPTQSTGGSRSATLGSSSGARERTRKNQGARRNPQQRAPALLNEHPQHNDPSPFQAAVSRCQRSLRSGDDGTQGQGRQQSKGLTVEQAVREPKGAQVWSHQAEPEKQQFPLSQQNRGKERGQPKVPLLGSGRRGWSTWEWPPQQSQSRPGVENVPTAVAGQRTQGGAVTAAGNKGKDRKDPLKCSRTTTPPQFVADRKLAEHLINEPPAKKEIKRRNTNLDQEPSVDDETDYRRQQKAVNSRRHTNELFKLVENTTGENKNSDELASDQAMSHTSNNVQVEENETELQKNMSDQEWSLPGKLAELTDEENTSSDETIVVTDKEHESEYHHQAASPRQHHQFRQTERCVQTGEISGEADKLETVSSPEHPRTGSPETFYVLFQDWPNSPEKSFVEQEDDYLRFTFQQPRLQSTVAFFPTKERPRLPKETSVPKDEVFTRLEFKPSQSPGWSF